MPPKNRKKTVKKAKKARKAKTPSSVLIKSPSPEKDSGAEATSTIEAPSKIMPLESSSDDDDDDAGAKIIRPTKTFKNDTDSGMGLVVKAPAVVALPASSGSGRRGLVGRTPPSDPSSLNFSLAKNGCHLCTAVAVCCTAHAQGYTHETMEQTKDIRREKEQAMFAHVNPKVMEENEIVMKGLEEGKMEVALVPFFGPLCCGGLWFDQRASSAGLNHEKHAPIHKFVELLGQVDLQDSHNKLSDAQLRGITEIIKVNPIIDHEESTSWFFTPIDKDNTAAGYSLILDAETQKFTSLGPNSHLHFFCKTHRRKFRVGYYTVKWTEGNKYATFGDARIDKVMKLPMKEKPTYRY